MQPFLNNEQSYSSTICVVWFKGNFYIIQEIKGFIAGGRIILWRIEEDGHPKKIVIVKIRDDLVLGSLCGSGFYRKIVENGLLKNEDRIIFCSTFDSNDICHSFLVDGENASLDTIYNRPLRTVKNWDSSYAVYSNSVGFKFKNHYVSVLFESLSMIGIIVK